MNSRATNFCFAFIVMILLQGCITSAVISNFPTYSTYYDFEKLSESTQLEKYENLRYKTIYEYYLKSEIVDDSILVHTITGALNAYRYHIKILNRHGNAIIAQRGLKANEWKSVVGIYYQTTDTFSDIYIRVQISQDFVGGWEQDRAMELGRLICRTLQQCTQSYPIKTSEAEPDDWD